MKMRRRAALFAAAITVAVQATFVIADTASTYSGATNGTWNSAANWIPAIVPNNGNGGNNYLVEIGAAGDPNVNVNLNFAVTVDGVVIDSGSSLTFQNGTILTSPTIQTVGTGFITTVSGNFVTELAGNTTIVTGSHINIVDNSGISFDAGATYTDNGTISLLSGGSTARVALVGAGTVTFAGNGTINMVDSNNPNNRIEAFAAGITLDNTANHTIQGVGSFQNADSGAVGYTISNEGTISAIGGHNLILNPGAGVTNTGTLQAGDGTNAGTLFLTTDTYTNTGGVILANNGSVVSLNNGATIVGGTLKTLGTGVIATQNGQFGVQFNGPLTIATGAQINIHDNSGINFNGGATYTNNGNISMNSGGSSSRILLVGAGTVTIGGNGIINMVDSSNPQNRIESLNTGNALTLDIPSTQTIQGNGEIQNVDGGTATSFALTNEGLISAVGGHTLLLNPGAGVTNTGTLRAGDGTNPGTLVLANDIYTNTGGLILANNGSTVSLNNAMTIIGGTLQTLGTGVIATQNGQFGVQFNGPLTIATGTQINIHDNSGISFNGGATYTNNGNISMNSGGSSSRILLVGAGTVTIGGNGVINMIDSGNPQNRIESVNSGSPLTLDIPSTQTIQGVGQIQNIDGGTATGFALINEGTITALTSANNGHALVLAPGSGVTNSGTIQAATGFNTLIIADSIVNTPTGTIIANTDSTVQLTGTSSIAGGTLKSITTGRFVTLNGQITSFANSLTLATGSEIDVHDNSGLQVAVGSTLTNNGLITLNSTGSSSRFQIFAPIGSNATLVTLAGNGIINMVDSGNPQNRIEASAVGLTLDNTAAHTVQGVGVIQSIDGGTQFFTLTNEGLISAVGTHNLVLNPGAGVVNTSTIRAGDGTAAGSLVLQADTFTNTGGLFLANTSSSITLNNGATVVGGTLQSKGTGVFTTGVNQTTAQITGNTTIAAGTQFNIIDNTVLNFAGGFTYTNNGTISLLSGGDSTRIYINGGGTVTFTGTGSINMVDSGNPQNRIEATAIGMTLNNTAGFVIQGVGSIQPIDGGTQNFILTNEGLISAVGTHNLVLNPGAGVVNTSTIRAGDGTATGSLVLAADTYTNAGGLFLANTGSAITLNNGTTIVGGTLQSKGTGFFTTGANQSTPQITGNTTIAAGTQIHVVDNSNLNFASGFTYTNNGTISLLSGGDGTRLFLNGGGVVTFAGTGAINLADSGNPQNRIEATTIGMTLDNTALHTIEGVGTFNTIDGGTQFFTLANEGTLLANVAGKTLLVSPGVSTANTGTLEATGGGTLNVTGVFLQDAGGVLTAGTYISNAGSTIVLTNSANITQIAAPATVILNGAGSTFLTGTTSLDSTLVENDGTLEILSNRSLSASQAFINAGLLQLGGGTFSETSLTNNSTGTILGFGTIANRPLNHGTIEANGGTLTLADGINGGSGTIQSDAGATLDLSGGTSGSNGDNLVNNGNIALGNNNITVSLSYTNANFGIGDAFNKHANVTTVGATTGGKIIANGDNVETVSTATIDFQNVHVGTTNSLSYNITNTGTTGPQVLYAIQPTDNGGTISDGRLSGSGVTSSNVGPLALAATSSPLTVTFTANSAGALTGQSVHIDNNFDNIAGKSVAVTGAAFRFAAPSIVSPNPVLFLPNHHVLDAVSPINLSITNTVAADGFSEKLDSSATGIVNNGITLTGGFNLLAPSATLANAYTASIDTSTPGHKTATATLNFVSDGEAPGTVGNSGLGQTPLPLASQTVTAAGDVFRFASPAIATPNPISFGNHHVDETVITPIAMTNNVPADNFSEALDSSLSGPTNNGISYSGGFTVLAPGVTLTNAYFATLDTSVPGLKSGSVTANFASNGQNSSGLGITALPAAAQTLSATGAIFRLASAGPIVQTTYNLGVVHVGDFVFRNPSFSNTAANDGFSETLRVNISSHTATVGITTGSSDGIVHPGGSNSGFVSVALDTSVAQLGRTGSQTFHFQSDGNNPGGFGDVTNDGLGITDLPTAQDQSVTLTADVLNYAVAKLALHSGSGSFSSTDANHFTLNFGDVAPGDTVSSLLDVLNAVAGPADTLGGGWTNNAPSFTIAGIGTFSGITAGNSTSGPTISFTASNSTQNFDEELILNPVSSDSAGDFNRSPVFLDITASVTAVTPEPTSLSVLAIGSAALLVKRRRRSVA